MGLSGQILLLLTVLVATSHSLPDGLMTLPDASVFELKPPKEFLELFRPDDSKNLTNPMKSPLIAAMTSNNLQDVSKFLPDPSVFEVEPPKEFSELFRFKEKENIISAKKESSDAETTIKPDLPNPAVVDINQPKENLDIAIADTEKLVKPMKESTGTVANQPDKKQIFDPKVFEMKPPKEFLELFKPKDKDNLVKEKENISSDKIPSDKVTSLPNEKPIPNPNVFEIKPPEQFLDQFQLNKKETDIPKVSSGAEHPILSLPDEKESLHIPNEVEIKPLPVFNNWFHFNEESYKPVKWPSWSFNVNNLGDKGFSDWFHLHGVNPQESNKIEKQTETIETQKPQNVHWSQQTFESHSHYHQSPPEDKEFRPFNMFASNAGVAGYQNVFSANNDGNDIQVLVTDKTPSSTDKVSGSANIVVLPPLENTSHDEKGVKTNKYADATVLPKDDGLVKKDTTEIKSVDSKLKDKVNAVDKSENHQSPPKIAFVDSPVLVPVPVQLIATPQRHLGFGNMMYMSTRYPPQYQLPSMNLQMPSHTYGFVYTNKPNNQIPLRPHSSEVKPEALAHDHSTVPQSSGLISGINLAFSNGDKLQNEDQSVSGTHNPNALNVPSNGEANQEGYIPITKPATINQNNIPTNPPFNFPVFGSNGNTISQSNNFSQYQKPAYMNVPYGTNSVPLNYVMGNDAPLNIPLMNNQINTGHGVMVANPMVGGYNQNNLYALVPIANDYYKPIPYFNNIPSNGNGYQVPGQVYNVVPANNMLLTTKDEDDL